MSGPTFDDLRITLTARADGRYDLHALLPDGRELHSEFTVPLTDIELEEAVLHVARGNSRKGPSVLDGAAAAAAAVTTPGVPTMAAAVATDPGRATGPTEIASEADVEALGEALAGALFGGDLGAAYDRFRQQCELQQRGLRLILSLAAAPALLSIPWEFLYRRPRFLASQRHTPLVRHLETGTLTSPPAIESTVRVLGVISSPRDLAALDVGAEKARVEKALAKTIQVGRVDFDWLDPATPRGLREALRDGSYHILHYVGHSSFTAANEGAIYLEDADGRSAEIDSTALATLLSDQNRLRLVVLNSCQGARTTLNDPYAGVATTLIQLGVPAVAAMQFEISDDAAILFAEELYTNLIGRQDSIDAAVAEARKAIYIELDKVEWATPVLYLRDPDVQLFDFRMPIAPLPPPVHVNKPVDRDIGHAGGAPKDAAARIEAPATVTPTNEPTPPPPDPPLPPDTQVRGFVGPPPKPSRGHRRTWAIAGAGLLVVAAAVTIGALVVRDDGSGTAPTTPAFATLPTSTPNSVVSPDSVVPVNGPAPRPHTGYLAVQIDEADGSSHIHALDLGSGTSTGATTLPGAIDSQPSWDPATNRLAFTRQVPSAGSDLTIDYVVPDDLAGAKGKRVAPLVEPSAGSFDHFPAWANDGALFYARTRGCRPSTQCTEDLRRATFNAAVDEGGFLDALSVASDDVFVSTFQGVTGIAADPLDRQRAALTDGRGLFFVDGAGGVKIGTLGNDFRAVSYTSDGQLIVAISGTGDAQRFHVYQRDGTPVAAEAMLGNNPDTQVLSISRDETGHTLVALAASMRNPNSVGAVRLNVGDDGGVAIANLLSLGDLSNTGTPRAVSR